MHPGNRRGTNLDPPGRTGRSRRTASVLRLAADEKFLAVPVRDPLRHSEDVTLDALPDGLICKG